MCKSRQVWSLCLLIVLAVAATMPLSARADGPADIPSPDFVKKSKFSTGIAQLVQAAQSAPQGAFAATAALNLMPSQVEAYVKAGLMHFDDAGRVQVNIHLTSASGSATDALGQLGVVIERQSADGLTVQGRAAVDGLLAVAELPQVRAITLPRYGHVNVGAAMTEGDAILDFDDLRAALGVDGSGVTVGVISDGIFGLADAMASGDLPPTTLDRDGTGKLVSTSGGVIATSFRADGDLEAGLSGGSQGAEGTAMLEIIHDIAPGAQLRFANFATELEFIEAVDFLAANSDIVVDDIGFFGMPYDQSSTVSVNTATELNRPTNRIRGYYTSVANQARRHYEGEYLDSGLDGSAIVSGMDIGNLHLFADLPGTSDCLDVGSAVFNRVRLDAGQVAAVFLVWNDTFGSPSTDYDLYVRDASSGTLVAAGVDDNINVTKAPAEIAIFSNTTSGTRFYDVMIQNFENASAPKTFDMFILGASAIECSNGDRTHFNFNTLGSSVPAQSDAGGGVVSVGAINASEPGADQIATYSSRGPANNGAMKPDVTAIDGVSVTGAGGFSNPFFGTSAAAPHVAGLAALLLSHRPDLMHGESGDNPDADRAALRAAIVGSAVDLGDPGDDNTYGAGRVNGMNAAQALDEEPTETPTPTPTPTPTAEPVPSASEWALVALGLAFSAILFMRTRRRAGAV